ncbi:Trk system potassium transporter TrkA [Succinatimonas hippei]|uniref:Trk system potassium transporter TrkA n=1 Tax=Succinatimonas hippei TaxID=626938 RepID=UPI0026F02DCB|nr:Trk system potassium transporter TrkA [Succinatimonas hippei]
MRIIIIGATTAGIGLAEYLVGSGHAVTLIDTPSEELAQIGNRLDLRVVQGMPSRPSVLRSAGAENTELLVATSNIDEINMAACSIAASLFQIPRKIARIRTPDYLTEADEIFGPHAIPIDHIIAPEHLIADFIMDLIDLPGALSVSNYCSGRLVIAAAKCSRGGKLLGQKVSKLEDFGAKVSVLALYRNERPVRDFLNAELSEGDEIYFCCEKSRSLSVLGGILPIDQCVKTITIAGGSHISDELARRLSRRFRVKLIESDPQRAKRVADSLQDTEVEIFCSNPSDINFILEEHIYDSDYFIAATNDDETNIISSFMIKRTNHAKTFTIIRNESYLTLASSREIDTIVSPKDATISELLSNIRQDGLEKTYLFRHGMAEGVELAIRGSRLSSRVIGKKVDDINLPKGVTLGLITRGNKVLKIDKDLRFEDGDHLIAFLTDHKQLRHLTKLFRPRSFWIPSW